MPDLLLNSRRPGAPFRAFALAAGGVTLLFSLPLLRLAWFALGDDLFSYIPLIPFAAGYLGWVLKSEIPKTSAPAPKIGAAFFVLGLALAALSFVFVRASAVENSLGLAVAGWILCLAGAGFWSLGASAMRALVFPFCLLLFMIPFPPVVRSQLESLLQHGSAVVAGWLFALVGTPVLHVGTFFRLSNISLEVAPECSGIHSSWVLFIVSLVAGRMILRRPWRRAVFCLAVLPLALLRNGFRVFFLGQLCLHFGPQMINSPLHHHGGPVFFVMSLLPFFLLLWFLRRSEESFSRPLPSN